LIDKPISKNSQNTELSVGGCKGTINAESVRVHGQLLGFFHDSLCGSNDTQSQLFLSTALYSCVMIVCVLQERDMDHIEMMSDLLYKQ